MGKLFRALNRSLRHLSKTENEKKTGKRDWGYDFFELKCAAMDTLVYSWWTPVCIFWEFLERCWSWLPILWKDRNWDHSYILDVLEHKIKQTRLCIGKYNRHTTVDQDCKNMRIAEILINRIRHDDYTDSFMVEHNEKWGELEFDRDRDPDDDVLFDNKFSKRGMMRAKVRSQKDWDQENKEHLKIIQHGRYQKNQDYDYLFKHLKKHLERWWD